MSIPTQPCPSCRGTGTSIDHGLIGSILRQEREEADIGLNEMARRLGLNASYLSDMERGNRHWSLERIEEFRKQLTTKQ
jgi:predicted transcriptional regulator